MKHELRQFLEKGFQSYDDLKGLSERLKTSAAAIEVMLAPDSHNDINLAGVNKSAANLILSALFQGKPYESGEYKPQKSIGIPFCRESIFRANTETICRELEALKRYVVDKTTLETALEKEKKIYQRISEAAEKLRYFLDKDKEARLKAYKESPFLFAGNIFDTASYEVVIPKELTNAAAAIEKALVYWRKRLFEGEQPRSRVFRNIGQPSDQDAINAVKKQLEDNGIAILSIESGPCKTPKTKEIILDLSQPIKELKRFNKQLNKSIELQAGIPSNLAGTGMDYRTYDDAEKQRESDRKTAQENEAIAKDLEEDVKTLETVLDEGIAHLAENAKEGRTSCNMEEAHNAITCLTQQNIKIVKVLQKRLQNGNI